METNPVYYGLPAKLILKEIGQNRIGLVKIIKSRIIQKDAIRIVTFTNQIKSVAPELEVTLICSRNICSKSIAMLELKGVTIEFAEL